jgi:hypothetical protein
MNLDKINGQNAVEVRLSALELSAWGFNPWRAPHLHRITLYTLNLHKSLLAKVRPLSILP